MPIILTNPCCCNTVPCDCTWRIAPEYATTGEGDGSALRVEWDAAVASATAAFEDFILLHIAELASIVKYLDIGWLDYGNTTDPTGLATNEMTPLRTFLNMNGKGAVKKLQAIPLDTVPSTLLSANAFQRELDHRDPLDGFDPTGFDVTQLWLTERLGTFSEFLPPSTPLAPNNSAADFLNTRIAIVRGKYRRFSDGPVTPSRDYFGIILVSESITYTNNDSRFSSPDTVGAAWADEWAPASGDLLLPVGFIGDTYNVTFAKLLDWDLSMAPDTYPWWQLTNVQASVINPTFPPDPLLEPIKYCSKIPFTGHTPPVGSVEEGYTYPVPFNPNGILFNDSLKKDGDGPELEHPDDPSDDCESRGFGVKSVSFGYRSWKVFRYLLTPCENESGSPIYARTYEEIMFPASITLVGGGGAIRYTGEPKEISDSETWENIESWEMAPCPVVYDFVPCDDLIATPTRVKSYSILDDGDVLFTDLGGGAKCWTNTGETFTQGAWDVVLGAFTMAPTGCEDPVCGEAASACSWSYNGPFGLAYAYTTGPCPEVGHCVSYTDWMDGPTTGIVLEVWPNDDTAGGASAPITSSGAFTDLGVAKSSVSADLSFFPVAAGSEPVVGKWYKQGGVCMVVDGVTTLATCDAATWAPTDGPFDTEAECNAA